MFKFAVSISGFSGQPATLLCSLDEGMLIVAKSVSFRPGRVVVGEEELPLVSNLDLPDLDFRYTDELMRDAIRSYFERTSRAMVTIVDELARFRPDNAIEKDKIDEKGPRYALLPEMTNGQIAVLAAVAYVDVQSPISSVLDAMDEMAELYSIMSI